MKLLTKDLRYVTVVHTVIPNNIIIAFEDNNKFKIEIFIISETIFNNIFHPISRYTKEEIITSLGTLVLTAF